MKLPVRYAIYFAFAMAASAVLALTAIWLNIARDQAQVRVKMVRELKAVYLLEQQDSLRNIGDYLSARMFNPLHRLDVAAINDELARLRKWLPIQSIYVLDRDKKILTDGTAGNPRYGERLDDDRIEIFALPHVFSLTDAYGVAFAIHNGGTVAGYGYALLSAAAVEASIESAALVLDQLLLAHERTLQALAGAAIGLAVLIAIPIGWWISRGLSRPLERMNVAARRFASGDFSGEIAPRGSDELGQLAVSLNRMAHDLEKTNRLLANAQKIAGVGSWEFSVENRRFSWSEQCYRIFGERPDHFAPVGRMVLSRVAPGDRSLLEAIMAGDIAEVATRPQELRIVRGDCAERVIEVIVEPPAPSRPDALTVAGTFQDVTDRKLSEERLSQLANFDPVTKLPNRYLFSDRLRHSMRSADRSGRSVGLMFVDLDRFKTINDTLGHHAGDELLRHVATRLVDSVREVDTVARLGGDEFTVVLEDLSNAADAAVVAEKLIAAVGKPLRISGQEVFVTPSIGITVYPADGTTVEALLKNADAAMYRAKDSGRNTYQFFTAELNQRMQERLRLETMLRGALDRNEFDLAFQPQIALASGELVGFEALLRWNPPDRGPIPPAVFVPILEDTGLIAAVGDWALRRACLWAAEWRRDTGMQTTVSVNLSPRQFKHGGLVRALQGALAHSGLPPELLELEITEGVLLDPDDSLRVIDQIKQVGVRLALDDFGTGYSSLAYLKRYPIDRLKIDRSFVRDINVDQDDATIAAAIIGLAHSLGIRVIAEGVETEEQRRFLHERGCDEVQGYLFARPMAGRQIAQWWRERSEAAASRLRSGPVQIAAVSLEAEQSGRQPQRLDHDGAAAGVRFASRNRGREAAPGRSA